MTLKSVLGSFSRNPQKLFLNLLWRFTQRKDEGQYIFILGAPRSGTTLVKAILSAHSDLTSLEEESSHIFINYRDIFQLEIAEIGSNKINFLHQNSQDIVDFYHQLTNDYLKDKQASRFVDKVHLDFYMPRFLENHFPNARFLQIFRDGRDCYCSARIHPHIPQARHGISNFAKFWGFKIRSSQRFLDHPRFFSVSYENLTSMPEATVRSIMGFLGEDYEPQQIDPEFYSQTPLSSTFIHQNLNQPINSLSQGRWKKELTPYEVAQFNEVAGSELLSLGYVVGRIEPQSRELGVPFITT